MTGAPPEGAGLPDVAPVIPADGLVLRPWSGADAAAVLVMADDEQSRRWSPSMRSVLTLDDAAAWIDRRLLRRTDWAVVDAGTGRLAGRVGLHHHDPDDRLCEIGYGVSPAFRRQGVAGRAVRAAVGYAFGPAPAGLGLHRVHLHHAVGNVGSCRTAWAHGFAYEGLAREGLSRGDGTFDDVHLHARLADDPSGPLRRVMPADPVELVAGPYQLCVPDPDLDAPAVAVAHADPAIALYNPGPTDLEGAREWCRRRADWTPGTHASWLVKEAVGGALLGAVSVHEADPEQQTARVGYWVTPQARGRGVGTAALTAASRFSFEAVGLRRIELFHAVDNVASCRLAEKAGYAVEGTHRKSFRYGDGVPRDEHTHARLATD